MKTFRWLPAPLVAALILTAACGGGDDDEGADTRPAVVTATTAAPTGSSGGTPSSEEPESAGAGAAAPNTDVSGELLVWHYATTDAALEVQQKMAGLFNETYPNVEVTFEFQPFEQMTQKLLSTAALGSGPDVVLYQWGDAYKLVDAAVIQPLDDLWASWPEADMIAPSVQHEVNGELYAVQPYVNLIALYYNKTILDEVGVEPPATVDELETAMAAVTDAGHEGLVFDGGPGVSGWWGGMPWMRGACVDITMSDEAAIESVLARTRSWIDNGYMSQDVVTLSQAEAMDKFLAGDVGFTVNGNWELGDVNNSGIDYGVVKIPDGECESAVFLGGEGASIGSFATDPELAFEFLTRTYLSREGGVALIEDTGSLSTRLDTVDEPAIADNPALAVFATQVPDGMPLPAGSAENEAQSFFGDTWSGVAAGQFEAINAAADLVAKTPGLLDGS